MNAQLANAFRELRAAGALGVPSEEEVQSAPDGQLWHGEGWDLIKHREVSYTTHTGNRAA